MAKLKSLSVKDKKYIFTAYENDRAADPAFAVFNYFPLDDEFFFCGDRTALVDKVDPEALKTDEGKQAFVSAVLEQYLSNIRASRVDYPAFLRACVKEFGDFEGPNGKVRSVDDFLKLPEAAVRVIGHELYVYARKEDTFSMGESKP
jgi:hypothetical protein